jgi:acyl carrier protein
MDMNEQTAVLAEDELQQLLREVAAILASVLGLAPQAIPAQSATQVLGAIPELDSMSVVTFLISLEEQYGIMVHDDEVDAAIFENLGTIVEFLAPKLDC